MPACAGQVSATTSDVDEVRINVTEPQDASLTWPEQEEPPIDEGSAVKPERDALLTEDEGDGLVTEIADTHLTTGLADLQSLCSPTEGCSDQARRFLLAINTCDVEEVCFPRS